MEGVVYRSTGSWYVLKDSEGKWWNARIKGVMKLDGITSTNPVAVGDHVAFEPENATENIAMIHGIKDRRNYINRQSPRIKSQQHIIAANVDQSLLIATLREPRTSPGFIDRFLVACEMYHVPAAIIFNKSDLYRKKEEALYEELAATYTSIGYGVHRISLKEGTGVAEVVQLLKDRITLVSGHSGVGKSSFINAVLPEKNLRTQDVSGWSGKGQHTTTFAEMFELPFGGLLIDTPGIKEFGLVGLEKAELSGYFPEMRTRLQDCQFNNCLHAEEPGCAIKEAVAEGEIAEERYFSYRNMLASFDEEHFKR
jgi:ribosome biogenesis GTPase / thiamine phosphate phosphatase